VHAPGPALSAFQIELPYTTAAVLRDGVRLGGLSVRVGLSHRSSTTEGDGIATFVVA
jgi:hypothetical protein